MIRKVLLTTVLFCYLIPLTPAAARSTFSGRTFAATYMTLNNSFFVALDNSIREACEAEGDRLLSYNPDFDQVRQIDQIQDMIAQKVDGIFLNPVDWKGIRPALEEAMQAGIPVFVVDAPVFDCDLVVSTISSDNWTAGELIALDLLARRSSARIAILDHPTNKPSIDRLNGFLDTLANHQSMKVVAQQSAFGTLESAVPLMENILQSNSDLTVVLGTNDPTSIGAISALEAAQRLDDILVYSIDGSPEGQVMVREGKMMATVAQSPRKMGRAAVETAYAYMRGEQVEKDIIIPVTLITNGNIYQYPENVWQ